MSLFAGMVPKSSKLLELGFTKMMQYHAAIELESKRLFEKVLFVKIGLRAKVSNLLANHHTKSIARFLSSSSPHILVSTSTKINVYPFVFQNLYNTDGPRARVTKLGCEERSLGRERLALRNWLQ
jgi:hypothetical protein